MQNLRERRSETSGMYNRADFRKSKSTRLVENLVLLLYFYVKSEMLMMLVEETERTSLESHCLVDRAMNLEEHLEHLLKVIKSMYK